MFKGEIERIERFYPGKRTFAGRRRSELARIIAIMEPADMNRDLRILMLEDAPDDAELAERELRKAGIDLVSKRVETRESFLRAIEEFKPDIILSDYKLPNYSGTDALDFVRREHPDLPVIMVTGALSDIEAVELINAGAKDYVLKDRLARLAPAVQRALSMAEEERARKSAEQALQKSHDELEQRVRERTAELTAANSALQTEKSMQEVLIGKLAEAHSQLLQSEKLASIGELAAGVAHEINNPIGFVNSNLGALKRYVDDLLALLSSYEKCEGEMTIETRSALSELKHQVDIDFLRMDVGKLLSESMVGLLRVKRIVQDLTDFSHVDESEVLWADLEQGLNSTLNIVWQDISSKAKVVKEYAGIPKIECMPAQINQVFMNILLNAMQAIERDGRITIRTGQNGNEEVWVEIEDNGRGIKPEHMERIFDPFFTTKPAGMGTGLGLSLSYSIIKKHGGRIEVKSSPGMGAIFKVVLPQHTRQTPIPASRE